MSIVEPRVSFSSNFASLFSVIRHNSSVFFHLNLYIQKVPIKVQIFRLSTACMKINQIFMSLFKPQVSFPLILQHPSVSSHKIPLEISNWIIICFWQKEPINVPFFRLLSALMKVHPIPLAIFDKVRVYSNFASLFSVVKDNSFVFFYLKPHILWTKIAHRNEIFRLLSFGRKFTKFLMSYLFETTSQFFCKLCFTLQCHER